MAIRYCGDIEVRLIYKDGSYRATLRAPGLRANGTLPRSLRARTRGSPTSPEAYDTMALAFLRLAERDGFPVAKEGGRIEMRRVFQAPCPYRT